MPKEVKQAIQTFKRDKKGKLITTWIDIKTGKPVTNFKGYDLVDSTDQQMKELTGDLPGEEGDKPPVPQVTAPPVKKIEAGQRADDRGDRPRSQGDGDFGDFFGGDESNDFGYKDKPGFMDFAGMLPGVAGLIGGGVNLGWNAKNVKAINDARKKVGLEPLSTAETLKGAVKVVSRDVTKKGEKKRGYGVALGGVMADEKTGFTPQEVRLRDEAEQREKVKQEAKTQLGLKTTAEAKNKLHPELSPNIDPVSTPRDNTPISGSSVSYTNQNAQRNQRLNPDVEALLDRNVKSYFGPDYKAEVYSGKGTLHDKKGNPLGVGNANHPKGTAGDMNIKNTKTGEYVTGDQLADFAAFNAGEGFTGIGGPSVGYMGTGSIHLDTNHPSTTAWKMSEENAQRVRDVAQRGFGLPGPGAPIPQKRPEDTGIMASMANPADAVAETGQNLAQGLIDRAKTPTSVSELEGYIRDAAIARNIDPDVAVAVAKSEGLQEGTYQSTGTDARTGKPERSFGPFQLNIDNGLGNYFQKVTGLDPQDPKTVKEQIDFSLDYAAEHGWGSWYGAARVGIDKKQGLTGATALGNFGTPKSFSDYSESWYRDKNNELNFDEAAEAAKGISDTASGFGFRGSVGSDPSMGRSDTPSSGRSSFAGAGSIAGARADSGLGSGSSSYGGTRGGDVGRGPGGSTSAGAGRGTSTGNPGVGPGRGLGPGGPSLGGDRPSFGGSTSAAFGKDSPSESGSKFGGSGLGTPDKDKDKDSHGAKSGF